MDMLLLVVVIGLLGSVRGQSDNCPVSLPCTCVQHEIDCQGLNLIKIPAFQATGTKFQRLSLGNNAISSVEAGSFANLNVDDNFLLDLGNNRISEIANDAFQGISDRLGYLYLSDNNLNNVPDAIAQLNNLKSLQFVNNPINDINDVAIQAIADTVTSVHFGSEQVTSWPSGLNRLNVNDLKVNIPITSFPVNVFDSFADALENLEIIGAKFFEVPIGMGTLSKLHSLTISDNPVLSVDAFPTSVLQGLGDTLVTLNLQSSRLATIPEVLEHLPGLNKLDLSNNPISFIPDKAVPANSRLQFLSLPRCQLKRYPVALSKLEHLTTLDLSSNLFRTVENMDFNALSNLISLDIKNNPVEYIASRSFRGMPALQVLDMSNMKLKSIPTALKDLTNLQYLDLTGNEISCTCSLSWMSAWAPVHAVTVIGNCRNIDTTIADYIKSGLPFC